MDLTDIKRDGYPCPANEFWWLVDRVIELEGKLAEANQAFDDCTGDYAKELVADETWRRSDAAV